MRASAQLLTDTQQGIRGGAELVGATVANTLLPAVKSRVLAEQGAPPGAVHARYTACLEFCRTLLWLLH